MNTFGRKDIEFSGRMESGGLLEDFGILRLMPDKSLEGFIEKALGGGMPLYLYGGKAHLR